MLVKVSQIVRMKAEKENELDKVYALHERVGLGLLHYKSLRWAFVGSPHSKLGIPPFLYLASSPLRAGVRKEFSSRNLPSSLFYSYISSYLASSPQ